MTELEERDGILTKAQLEHPEWKPADFVRETGIPRSAVYRWFDRRRKGSPSTGEGFDNIVKLCDWHVPYEDKKAVNCAINYCEETQPDIIIIDEAHDFYELSKFDKNPARKHHIQDEIDQTSKYFKKIRRVCPNARIILLESNHLDRLRRFLWKEGSALSSLRCLQVEKLLELDALDIEYMEYFLHKGVIFKHGSLVRQESAYTAKGEFNKEGCAGASGHTHRLGVYFVTKRGGSFVWIEGGCLCDLNPEYIKGVPNWQHGLAQFTFEKKGTQYFPQAIPIIHGKIIHGGKIITG